MRLALVFFTLLALAVHWPIFQGKIPLPAGIVTFYAPWQHLHQGAPQWPHVSELSDLVTSFYPWRAFTVEGLRSGELPLWNPHVLAGTPFLGATQSALFYPLTWLYVIFGTNIGWTANILLRIVLAGLFTTMFASRTGATLAAALAAGAIYVLSGSFVIWQGQALGDAWVWFPAVLYCIERLFVQPSSRGVACLAITFAMPVLAGHPESAFHIAAFGVVFAAFRLLFSSTPNRTWFVVGFLIAAVLGVALAAIQILPTVEWMTQIDPELGSIYAGRPAWEILALISRDFRSNPNSSGIHIPEGAGYAGLMALLLCGFAFLGPRRRDAWFWLIVIAVALQVAYAFGPADWLVDRIPIVQALKNNRVVLIVNFGIAMLAAMGISFLQSEVIRGWRNWAALGFGFAAIAAGTFVLRRMTIHHVPDWDQTPKVALALLLLSAVVPAMRLAGWFTASRFAVAAVAVILLDMGTAAFGAVPYARPREVFPPAPVFDFLAQQKQPFRMTGVDFAYAPNAEIMYGVSTISGYEIWLKRTAKLLGDFRTPNAVGLAANAESIVETKNRILDLLNVQFVVSASGPARDALSSRPDRFRPVFSEGATQVFENASVLPRAFAVSSGCVITELDDEAQLARVKHPAFDPLRAVVLASPSKGVCPDASSGTVEFRDTHFANRMEMEAEVREESILVWSEMHYPGWRVFVDNTEKELLRADYNLMAVSVPSGRHNVRFVFDPASLRIGKWISLVALVFAVVGFLLPARNPKSAFRNPKSGL